AMDRYGSTSIPERPFLPTPCATTWTPHCGSFPASVLIWSRNQTKVKAETPLPWRPPMRTSALVLFSALALFALPALAQTTQSDPAGFGGLADESGEEVNVSADNL